jgi:hypothetical protein
MDNRRYGSIEATTCLNFINLARKVKKNLQKKFSNIKGKDFDQLMCRSLKTFRINEQEFDYICTNNHLGGVRWYIKCPKCGRPALKLYLPQELKDREPKYLCKYCHKLKNASLLMGASKRYKKVVKPLKQLEKLRAQLLSKNITPEKAAPILAEYERIEKELAASPEYRLYKFQKEHGIAI